MQAMCVINAENFLESEPMLHWPTNMLGLELHFLFQEGCVQPFKRDFLPGQTASCLLLFSTDSNQPL
jgi:hypothetical protein